ncbi:hypothetical protein F4821DRAFT_220937 [Hypoxylon rubiginosum]|uniref:Uncharacterized protein n=1 Tax=Hypoxylon rubiginosum TaxID=110542 RepID=A0ACC0DN21_9PEZI|nr:hypothetical protein F4821DRAFT_220937 [Hypoxylon rubiginosum]
MPLPLPIPSKAAIHALRGIALGTSCAIGVIVEDRRRKISTLKTAVSNKEKLRSAKQYHGMANPAALQLDDAIFEDELHWHQLEDSPRTAAHDYPLVKGRRRRNSTPYTSLEAETSVSLKPRDISESSSSPTAARTQSSSPQHTQRNTAPSLNDLRGLPTYLQTKNKSAVPVREQRSDKIDQVIEQINRILAGRDEERLDRALNVFFRSSQTYNPSKGLDDTWVALSARLSKKCQEEGRWEDATKVLSVTISAGPLDERTFYDHNPLSIIEHWSSQTDENGHCPPDAIAAASHLFLASFKEKPKSHYAEVERIGTQLLALNLQSHNSPVAHSIYWRVLGQLQYPEKFTGQAIHEFFRHEDHKSVVKYFLLNYSKMNPGKVNYNVVVDCVVMSVEQLKGCKAGEVIRALVEMNRPGRCQWRIRSRWPMKLLHSYWYRQHDFPGTLAFFDEILSSGMLDKVGHPMGVYRSMVEISIKAGETDMAKYFYDEVVNKFPDMGNDIALKGFVAWAFAKTGDWDSVFEVFTEMQTLKHGQEDNYNSAFIQVLKLFAETHSVSEVRDFISKYKTDFDISMHRYMVTIVANMYGRNRDMPGFMSWLAYCSSAGFALDSGLCNAVLYNCSTQWNYPYPALRLLYLQIRKLDPTLIDNVTRRIMTQSAIAAGTSFRESQIVHSPHPRVILPNTLWHAGRTTQSRDVRIAMQGELMSDKPAKALSIYKRALEYGMPFCPYCLRLAVVANLRIPQKGPSSAMTLIETAHRQGEDVGPAVSEFIKLQLGNMKAGSGDTLLFMRNIVSQFETMHVVIDSSVLIEMASTCNDLGHFEKAIALCKLAADRGNYASVCFSRPSILVVLKAYSRLLDLEGLNQLIDDLLVSNYSTDKTVYGHFKATKRTVRKMHANETVKAVLDIIERGIREMKTRRTKSMADAKVISQETLRIMQDALADMQSNKTPTASQDIEENEQAQHREVAIET